MINMTIWGNLISLFFVIYSIILAFECFIGFKMIRTIKKREPLSPFGGEQKQDKYLQFK